MIPDLRLCTTRAEASGTADRQFCFELISTHKRWVLQATSAKVREFWVAGIDEAIEEALNAGKRPPRRPSSRSGTEPSTPRSGNSGGSADTLGATSPQSERMAAVLIVAGNDRCADCGAVDPTWCSINLGVCPPNLHHTCTPIYCVYSLRVSYAERGA
jgi:hypothetical protein